MNSRPDEKRGIKRERPDDNSLKKVTARERRMQLNRISSKATRDRKKKQLDDLQNQVQVQQVIIEELQKNPDQQIPLLLGIMAEKDQIIDKLNLELNEKDQIIDELSLELAKYKAIIAINPETNFYAYGSKIGFVPTLFKVPPTNQNDDSLPAQFSPQHDQSKEGAELADEKMEFMPEFNETNDQLSDNFNPYESTNFSF